MLCEDVCSQMGVCQVLDTAANGCTPHGWWLQLAARRSAGDWHNILQCGAHPAFFVMSADLSGALMAELSNRKHPCDLLHAGRRARLGVSLGEDMEWIEEHLLE